MARRYDGRTTTFSPDGRLFQVEYAMVAVQHAATCLAISTPEGIVVGCERSIANKLLDDVSDSEKVFRVCEHMICGVAGLSSDANILVLESRLIGQRYLLQYGFDIPCEQLVRQVSDIKQQFTQYGGKRPFGTSLLFVGWDEFEGYQLYLSDPSGNYSGWKAACIGKGAAVCVPLLKEEYNDSMTLSDTLLLATKALAKGVAGTTLRAEHIEIVTLVRAGEKTEIEVLGTEQLQKLVSSHGAMEQKAERLKRATTSCAENIEANVSEALSRTTARAKGIPRSETESANELKKELRRKGVGRRGDYQGGPRDKRDGKVEISQAASEKRDHVGENQAKNHESTACRDEDGKQLSKESEAGRKKEVRGESNEEEKLLAKKSSIGMTDQAMKEDKEQDELLDEMQVQTNDDKLLENKERPELERGTGAVKKGNKTDEKKGGKEGNAATEDNASPDERDK